MLVDFHGQTAGSAPNHQLDQPTDPDGQPQAPCRADYLCLAWRSASSEADALCSDLLDQVVCHWQATGQPDDPERRPNKARKAIEGFAGALVASLAPHSRRELFRPWTPNSFSASTTTAVADVGYRPAKAVRDALCHLGYLEVVEPARFGVWVVEPNQAEASRLPDRATTYRATPSFAALAAHHGVTSQQHFRLTMPVWPLDLRREKRPGSTRNAPRPVVLPPNIHSRPIVSELVQEMRDLNGFLDDFALTTQNGKRVFFGLHRIFSLPPDHPLDRLQDYRWDRHGRLYGRGVDCYQSMKGRGRRKLLIDREAVAEIDIRASWPTLIYGLLRRDLGDFDPDHWVPPANDPYGMVVDPATGVIVPREVVKAASSVLLTNKGTGLQRWPDEMVTALRKGFPDLIAEYPAPLVGDAIMRAHQHLALWKAAEYGDGLTLMHLESAAILAAMHRAKARGVPAFPIHDGFLVPESMAPSVMANLSEEFFKAFGCRPHIKLKV